MQVANVDLFDLNAANLAIKTGVTVTNGPFRPSRTVYANLSTIDSSPAVGDYLVITDASACTANTAVTSGGGTTHSCPVVYTTGWIAMVTN